MKTLSSPPASARRAPRGRLLRHFSMALGLATLLATGGCAGLIQPVQPWEKGNLARPEMAFDSDPLRQAAMEHIYSSKEASSGGTSVAGGGCGCN